MDSQTLVTIAELAAAGTPQLDIAKATNVHQSTVSRTINGNESARAIIESVRAQMIDRAAQLAADNMVEFMRSTDPTDKPYKFRASEKVLESIGALASHTQAATVVNLYQQHNEIHLDQAAGTALAHLGIDPAEVIDIEPE